MKILAVCQAGSCRSVGLARFCKEQLHWDALAASKDYNTPETLAMLFRWADRIVLAEDHMIAQVPGEFHPKVRYWRIGPDRFGSPFNAELATLCRSFFEGGGFD